MSIRKLKELVLKQGWAGRTISRAATVDRLNPILQSLSGVLVAHNLNPGLIDDALIRTLRMDIGKMSETILSCAGIAERNPSDAESEERDVKSAESKLLEALKAEGEIEHQMRSRAIIAVVLANTEARLQAVS